MQQALCFEHPMTENPAWDGWRNSATYLAHLYLTNDRQHYESLCALVGDDGLLDPMMVKGYVESLPVARALRLDRWAEGPVDWRQIAMEFARDHTPARKASAQRFLQADELEHAEHVEIDVMRVLAELEIDGPYVRITEQLARNMYGRVNRVLEALGGKWDRRQKAHVFKDDPQDRIDTVLLTGRVAKPLNFGFFETPPPMVDDVVSQADLRPGHRSLEPEGGTGMIADSVREIVGPENLVVVELQPANVAVLREKGHHVIEGDFLTMTNLGSFDRIVMNPPFSVTGKPQADIEHVEHAWGMLNPKGRLVSIMSGSVVFRENRKTQSFRELVGQYGEITENPEGAFRASGTLVRTVTVTLDRPG